MNAGQLKLAALQGQPSKWCGRRPSKQSGRPRWLERGRRLRVIHNSRRLVRPGSGQRQRTVRVDQQCFRGPIGGVKSG